METTLEREEAAYHSGFHTEMHARRERSRATRQCLAGRLSDIASGPERQARLWLHDYLLLRFALHPFNMTLREGVDDGNGREWQERSVKTERERGLKNKI